MQMMNLTWSHLKKWGKRGLYVGVAIYLLLLALVNIDPHPTCSLEEHLFHKQAFDIEFCALGGGRHDEKMRLRVYSKSGQLLAWRIATFAKESRLNYMAIEDTMIRYSDSPMDRINPPADCVLNMPPTWVDWLEARLPGGIPGVNHCGVVSDDVVSKAQEQWAIREEAENQKNEQAVREYNERSHAAPPTPAASK
jgi:hypothetical protein